MVLPCDALTDVVTLLKNTHDILELSVYQYHGSAFPFHEIIFHATPGLFTPEEFHSLDNRIFGVMSLPKTLYVGKTPRQFKLQIELKQLDNTVFSLLEMDGNIAIGYDTEDRTTLFVSTKHLELGDFKDLIGLIHAVKVDNRDHEIARKLGVKNA